MPKSDIRFTSGNVLLDMPFYELVRKYKVIREAPLPIGRQVREFKGPDIEPDVLEQGHQQGLYNKSVWTKERTHVGFEIKETDDQLVVLGHYDWRFDMPKSEMISGGEGVLLKLGYNDIFKYKVNSNDPLPTGEPYAVIVGEEEFDFERPDTRIGTSKESVSS